jgi:hypothetical protein
MNKSVGRDLRRGPQIRQLQAGCDFGYGGGCARPLQVWILESGIGNDFWHFSTNLRKADTGRTLGSEASNCSAWNERDTTCI